MRINKNFCCCCAWCLVQYLGENITGTHQYISAHKSVKDLSGSVRNENGWEAEGMGFFYLLLITSTKSPIHLVKWKLLLAFICFHNVKNKPVILCITNNGRFNLGCLTYQHYQTFIQVKSILGRHSTVLGILIRHDRVATKNNFTF